MSPDGLHSWRNCKAASLVSRGKRIGLRPLHGVHFFRIGRLFRFTSGPAPDIDGGSGGEQEEGYEDSAFVHGRVVAIGRYSEPEIPANKRTCQRNSAHGEIRRTRRPLAESTRTTQATSRHANGNIQRHVPSSRFRRPPMRTTMEASDMASGSIRISTDWENRSLAEDEFRPVPPS